MESYRSSCHFDGNYKHLDIFTYFYGCRNCREKLYPIPSWSSGSINAACFHEPRISSADPDRYYVVMDVTSQSTPFNSKFLSFKNRFNIMEWEPPYYLPSLVGRDVLVLLFTTLTNVS